MDAEKVPHISFQHPAFGAAVFAVVVDHVALKPEQPIVGAFSFLTGVIVPG